MADPAARTPMGLLRRQICDSSTSSNGPRAAAVDPAALTPQGVGPPRAVDLRWTQQCGPSSGSGSGGVDARGPPPASDLAMAAATAAWYGGDGSSSGGGSGGARPRSRPGWAAGFFFFLFYLILAGRHFNRLGKK